MALAYDIIQSLRLSEKISRVMEKHNCYAFRVDLDANKIEIKRAVEELFRVRVKKVNTLHRQGKLKRERTRRYGRTSAFKMAMVTLKEGDKIEVV